MVKNPNALTELRERQFSFFLDKANSSTNQEIASEGLETEIY